MMDKRADLRKHFKDEANKADSNKMHEERSAQLSSIEDTVANGIGALLNKDDNIGKLASAIDKLSMAKGDKGDPGKDGYTPIKGKDYYTNEEISQIADDIFSRVREPQDGEPGYTPVKGVDYYTDQEIRSMIEYIVSTIPKPKDGEDGKDAISPVIDYKKIITEVIKKIPKPKDGKPGKPGKDGKSSGGITGVMGLIAGAGITIDDTDRYYPIITSSSSSDEKVKLSAADPTAGYLDAKLQEGVQAIQYDITPTVPTSAPGLTYYDVDNHTLSTALENGVTLQHGQEMHVYGKNTSGAIIYNGNAVSLTSVGGSFNTFGLTDPNDATSSKAFIGIATQDIAINAFGYVTTSGEVRELDTNAFTEGIPLYVSCATPGQVTNTLPDADCYTLLVGNVSYKHAIHGRIHVSPIVYPKMEDLSGVNGTPLATDGQIPVWNQTSGYFDFNKNINDYLPLTGGTLGTESAGANLTVQGTLGTEKFTSFTVAGNWTLTAGWESTNDGGTRLNKNAAGTTSATFIGAASVVGTVYKVEFTMNASVTGGVKAYIGSQAESALYNPTISTPTTYTFYFTAITTTSLVFAPITTARFVITNISIKPVTAGTGELTNYGNILLGGKLKNPLSLSDNGLTIDTLGTVRVDGAFKTGGYAILGSSLTVATTITTTAGSITCTSGSFTNIRNGAITTSVDGLIESNSTAATVGVPVQMSPRIRLSGTVWDTGTTSSKSVNFKNEVLPISGNPGSARLLWGYDYNGGGYTELMSLQSNGVFKPFQATTAAAPAYVKGGIYFDTTLNKLRVGGAAAWETITSV